MRLRPVAAVLFDVDGTLMDDDHAVLLALTAFHAKYGSQLGLSITDLVARWKELLSLHFHRYLAGEASMQEQRRARIRDLFAHCRPGLSPADADRLFADYEGDYRASWSAYADSLRTLAALSRFPLAVLSNGDHAQQTAKLQKCGLASHFCEIVTSSEIGLAKPSSGAFVAACQRMHIPPEGCIYVGDNMDTDARASSAAGLMGVWLDRNRSRLDPGAGVWVIHSLVELPPLIEWESQ